MNKRSVGSSYEALAERYLETQGYRILEKNYRCRQGEIDLIAMDGEYRVFVEVKYRKDERNGSPLESVDPRKQRRISRTASWYLMCHPETYRMPCRFDVVGIEGERITLIRDAFSYIR